MTHFAYPNIKRGTFIGCGRFAVFEAEQQPAGYRMAAPESATLQDVIESAAILAPEGSDSTRLIYERIDAPDSHYLGDSLDLAYLLARISRIRAVRFPDRSGDIWCTGCIRLFGAQPALKPVILSEFEAKLDAFQREDNPDRIFIVPETNIDQHIRLRLEQQQAIRVWSLADAALGDPFEAKTILKVRRDELPALITVLFHGGQPSDSAERRGAVRLQNLRDVTVQIRAAGTEEVVGNGIAVSLDGKIVTAAHVVKLVANQNLLDSGGLAVDVYFPQAPDQTLKVQRATVVGMRADDQDDLVLLQLMTGETPLTREQLPVFGNPQGSRGNAFESYGYLPGTACRAKRTSGTILGTVDAPRTGALCADPVQLQLEQAGPRLLGAAVLDTARNLIVGLISGQYDRPGERGEQRDYAVNPNVLTRHPFLLPVQDVQMPKRPISRPQTILPILPESNLGTAWNHAPAPLATWVGRETFLEDICDDWRVAGQQVTGLIGFGGEGKSSLARKAVETILAGCTTTRELPDGVFWWGFYTRPGMDEFFEALLRYLSAGRIDPRNHPSTKAKVHFIAGMLYSGRYLFVLDGLEVVQHQNGDRYGLVKSDEFREFLTYLAAPGHQSFCLVTSRVPVLDLMEYTTYTHRDVTSLRPEEGQDLLKKLGVKGDNGAMQTIVNTWGSHALTLSLIGAILAEQYGGDARRIGEFQPPTADEARYARVNRVLQRYENQLTGAERACLLLFSAFRTPLTERALTGVFRTPPDTDVNASLFPLQAVIMSVDERGFRAMLQRLMTCRILSYDPVEGAYTTHPLVLAYYRTRLHEEFSEQAVRQVYRSIKEYYLSCAKEYPEPATLEEVAPLIEAVHYACQAGEYEEAYYLLRDDIQQRPRALLTDILGAHDSYLAMLHEFFPENDLTQDPQLSNPEAQGYILGGIGYALLMMGCLNEVESYYKRAIAINTGCEKWSRVSCNYQNLAVLYRFVGAFAASMQASRSALFMARRADHVSYQINTLSDQAWLLCLQGQLDAAGTTFGQTEALLRDIKPDVRYLYGMNGLKHADYLRRTGKPGYARQVTEANLTICLERGWKQYVSWCYCILGDLEADAGQHNLAKAHYDNAVDIARRCGYRLLLIHVLAARGRWRARFDYDAQAAFDDLDEALEYAFHSGYCVHEADIRLALARAYLIDALKQSPRWHTAFDSAWAQTGRAERMSTKMGYYWGKVEAKEIRVRLDNV